MKKIKRELKILSEDDGAMILDKSRGIYFQVNAVGVIILKGLSDGMSEDELVIELEKNFSLDHNQAKSDVSEFLTVLREMRLA